MASETIGAPRVQPTVSRNELTIKVPWFRPGVLAGVFAQPYPADLSYTGQA